MGMNEEQATVTIKGEVDIYSVDQFRESIEKSINQKKSKIILDCTELSYIDSTGMGVLIEMRNKTRELGQNMIVKNPRPNVKKLLALTGVDKIIEIIENTGSK
ncbi:STAS domain-containing protein [Eubacteriaceae bacterium ES3]|nr:STAS domain-containing protein [Eubacteriaceae bacterium ES3]